MLSTDRDILIITINGNQPNQNISEIHNCIIQEYNKIVPAKKNKKAIVMEKVQKKYISEDDLSKYENFLHGYCFEVSAKSILRRLVTSVCQFISNNTRFYIIPYPREYLSYMKLIQEYVKTKAYEVNNRILRLNSLKENILKFQEEKEEKKEEKKVEEKVEEKEKKKRCFDFNDEVQILSIFPYIRQVLSKDKEVKILDLSYNNIYINEDQSYFEERKELLYDKMKCLIENYFPKCQELIITGNPFFKDHSLEIPNIMITNDLNAPIHDPWLEKSQIKQQNQNLIIQEKIQKKK